MSEEYQKQFLELDEQNRSFIEKEIRDLDEEMKIAEVVDKKKDQELSALLADAGIGRDKIQTLEVEADKRIEAVLKIKPLELERDTRLATSREVSIARAVFFPTSITKRLTPPPYSCGGSPAADAACVPTLAECNPYKAVRGHGWWGRRRRKVFGWFWWLYVPPKNGALYVYPRWSVHGAYRLYSDDSWWNSAYARIKLKLKTNVYQWYWDGWKINTVLNRGDDNINICKRLDRGYTQSKSLHVTANKPVWIYNEFELDVYAKSKYAYTRGDFRTGTCNYIRVPWVWTYLI